MISNASGGDEFDFGAKTSGGYSHLFTPTTNNNNYLVFEGQDVGQTVSISRPEIREVSKFSLDFTDGYSGAEFSAPLNETGYTGAEYSSGLLVQTPSTQGSGSGKVVTIGLKAIIDGSPYSIQRIDVQVLLGRAR